jgi:hypothetical protein
MAGGIYNSAAYYFIAFYLYIMLTKTGCTSLPRKEETNSLPLGQDLYTLYKKTNQFKTQPSYTDTNKEDKLLP